MMSSPSLTEADIFNVARHMDVPEARHRYIVQVCAANRELKARVEALLRIYDEQQSFLEESVEDKPCG
jgi:hypothetical protein